MATIGISEFTFGYAFLYEQTRRNWGGLRAAPILPSLQQEKDEGWDAQLPLKGVDFYYQFKLTDYLSYPNASYIADGTYGAPYYRLSLHRRDSNRQHRLLRKLASSQPNVFYVAPEFNTLKGFNAAYLSGGIVEQSRLFPLSSCKDYDDTAQHHITFQPSLPAWIEHSKPKRHDESVSGRDLHDLYTRSRPAWEPVNLSFARRLLERVADSAREHLAPEQKEDAFSVLSELGNPADLDRAGLLLRASQIASIVFGAAIVLVGSAE